MRTRSPPEVPVPVFALVAVLLVVWLVVTIVGAIVKGLFWLVMVGLVLFLVTGAYGWTKKGTRL